MDPIVAAPEDKGPNHLDLSQCFSSRVVSGTVPVLVVDLVSSKSGGDVVSGSERSANEAETEVGRGDPIDPIHI
ncbi:hypothetical protein TorRG33x02_339850 [Trema orientale]|uniref:Uncharacterized protein n=1 Tax=Trema orientale TaxID=63057 RepID=A0A2P5AVX2_TREOI|nr:hypothetical protein TorRG33x02_339850 [Trema orientale]